MDSSHDSSGPQPALGSGLLLTDLYQLNMLQAYLEAGMTETAVFEFFVRKLPPSRNFLIAAGLETVVDFLEGAAFTAAELDWLRSSGRFSEAFVDHLEDFRFTGALHALREGTICFPDEPLLRLTAPLPEAQLLETRIINLMHFQTVVASKAARMVLAAPGKTLVDFGLRRAHGAEAGLLAARASYLAGFAGSATTPVAPLYDIPVYGTMAHSFIQAHDDEETAFEDFARARPDAVVLLLDTYDTLAAARSVIRLAPRLAQRGITVRGVRLDSGDLAAEARAVRQLLDRAGLEGIQIFASGGLDEAILARYQAEAVPIDGYGVGTSLTTASDAPALDCAYKLQVYAGQPKRKVSTGKATWPGRKQVYRHYTHDAVMAGDVLTCEGDSQGGEALIAPVMRAGRRLAPLPGLEEARAHAASELRRLPPALRSLEPAPAYPVEVATALRHLAEEADRARQEAGGA